MSRLTYPAYVLRRVMTGNELNGQADALSEPFRKFAIHLDSVDLKDRQAALDAFLAGRDDAESIINAMAEANPVGPPPEATDDETKSEEWPPLQLIGLPPVEPFPLEVFPVSVVQFVTEAADAIGCPPDFLAVPVLAVAGGTIGRSVSLLLKGDYFASSIHFAGCVGPPSDGKTPALKKVTRALRMIDEQLTQTYAQEIERWERENSDVQA